VFIPALWLLSGIFVYAGVNHLLVGLRPPRVYTHALFGFQCLLSAAGTIAIAQMYGSTSVEQYLRVSHFSNIFVISYFLCMPWFVIGSTGTRPHWPGWLLSTLYGVLLVAEFVVPYGILFAERPTLRAMMLPWGEQVTGHSAAPTPFLNLFWLAHILLFIYVAWACRRQYRRGQRRQALGLAFAVLPFAIAVTINILISLGVFRFVFIGAWGFVAMVLLMSWSLTRELHRSHERSQAILDNVPAVIWIKDLEGRYLFVNKHFERLFAWPLADVVGKSDRDLFTPALAEIWRASDVRVLERNNRVDVEEQVTVGSEQRTLMALKFPLRDSGGGAYALCGVATDITDSKRTADALRTLAQSSSAEDSATFFRDCAQQLARTYGADHAFIVMRADGGPALQAVASWPEDARLVLDNLPTEGTACGDVLQHGRLYIEHSCRICTPAASWPRRWCRRRSARSAPSA
jgi:PAS domain S-box-containing protein